MVGQGAGISSGRIVQNGAILGHKGQTQAVCILGQLLWLWVGRMLIPHRNSFHRAGKVGVKLLGKSVLEQQRCPATLSRRDKIPTAIKVVRNR